MKCPFCSAADTKVINSRPSNGGEEIRRRRECPVCEGRFTTFETVEKSSETVVKRSGKKVPYQRDRLQKGIEKACRKRPVSAQQIDNMISYIEKEAFRGTNREVTTEHLGKLVLKRLKDLDHVAYLRFASVYKAFRDIHDFNNEIKSLLKD